MGLTPCRRANKQTTDFTSHLSPQKAHNQSTTPPANLSTSPIPPPSPAQLVCEKRAFSTPGARTRAATHTPSLRLAEVFSDLLSLEGGLSPTFA